MKYILRFVISQDTSKRCDLIFHYVGQFVKVAYCLVNKVKLEVKYFEQYSD